MFYGYITNQHADMQPYTNMMMTYASENDITNLQIINDAQHARIPWEKRAIFNLILNTANPGDTIIVTQANQLARSTLQLLEILQVMARHQVKLIIIEHNLEYTPDQTIMTNDLIQLLHHAETEFIAKRTEDALKSRRANGVALGRPKGRKNKSRKLDRHRDDIIHYLKLNISKASIAKLVGCHPQTLYNYIQDQDLDTNADNNTESNVISLALRQTVSTE